MAPTGVPTSPHAATANTAALNAATFGEAYDILHAARLVDGNIPPLPDTTNPSPSDATTTGPSLPPTDVSPPDDPPANADQLHTEWTMPRNPPYEAAL